MTASEQQTKLPMNPAASVETAAREFSTKDEFQKAYRSAAVSIVGRAVGWFSVGDKTPQSAMIDYAETIIADLCQPLVAKHLCHAAAAEIFSRPTAPTGELPTVAGRFTVEASCEPGRDGQFIIVNGKGFLNCDGGFDLNHEHFNTRDDHYWPDRASAMAFLREVAAREAQGTEPEPLFLSDAEVDAAWKQMCRDHIQPSMLFRLARHVAECSSCSQAFDVYRQPSAVEPQPEPAHAPASERKDRLTSREVFMLGWKFHYAVIAEHCTDSRDVGRLLLCDFWPEAFRSLVDQMNGHVGKDAGIKQALDLIRAKLDEIEAVPTAELEALRKQVTDARAAKGRKR